MASTAALDLIIRLKDQASKGLDGVASKTSALGTVATTVGLAGVAALGAGIATLGATSISAAADFEKGLSSIRAVSGATQQEMEGISKLALQLGADTSFSAQEAAAGIEELIKGGLTIPDVMNGAAKSMLNLAAAGDVAIPEAAEIAANAMSMFNLKGGDMAHVADLIAGAANASSLSVSDFKFSMAAAGSIAAATGQSFDDLAQGIAIMGQAGIKGSDAGTSLKTMLMNLQPSTKAAKEMFSELGITTLDYTKAAQFLRLETGASTDEVLRAATAWANQQAALTGAKEGTKKFADESQRAWEQFRELNLANAFIDANGQFKSMAEIAEVLQEKTKDLTEAQRLQALETMFGSDAIRAAAIMAKQGAEGFEAMAASMGKVTAESVASVRLDNFRGSIEQLKGSWETFTIVLGTQVLPALRPLVDHLTRGINAVSSFAQTIASAEDPMAAFMGYIQPILPLLTGLGAAILTAVIPPFVAWAATAVTTAAATMTALAPVLLPIAAIGAAVGLLTLAWQRDWGGIRTTLTDWWEGSGRPIFDTLREWLSTTLTTAIARLSAFWTNTLQPALVAVWTFIRDSVIPLLTDLATRVFAQVQANIATLAAFWTNTLKPALQTVWNFIDTNVIPVLKGLADVFQAVVMLAVRSLVDFWTGTLQPALSDLWAFVDTKLMPVLRVLAAVAFANLKTAMATIADIWNDTLKPALSAAWDFIKTNLSPVFETLASKAQAVVDVLRTIADTIRNMPTLPSMAPDIPGFGGGRAHGGPVMSNTPYLVGERGPELFVPRASGEIVPNHQLTGATVNHNYYLTANYQHQDERSLRDDLRYYSQLYGGA